MLIINGSGGRPALGSATVPAPALVGVLPLHRTLSAEAVIAGIGAALGLESCDPDLVAVEARRAILRSDRAPGQRRSFHGRGRRSRRTRTAL